MRIIACRPADDQFWIGCSEEEAVKFFLPLLSDEQKRLYFELINKYNAEQEGYWDAVNETMETEEIYQAYFNVARDLSKCFPQVPHFPFANLWNGYSPYRKMDQKDISSLEELKEIKMTYEGKEYGSEIPIN